MSAKLFFEPNRHLLLAAAVAMSSCHSLSGSWYFQRESARDRMPEACDQASRLCLHLSVINDSSKELKVERIEIYTKVRRRLSSSAVSLPLWKCDPVTGSYFLAPGQLVVLTLPHRDGAACRIPMHAELTAEDEQRIRIDIGKNQPSSIPSAWLSCGVNTQGIAVTGESSKASSGEQNQQPRSPQPGEPKQPTETPPQAPEFLQQPFHCTINSAQQSAI